MQDPISMKTVSLESKPLVDLDPLVVLKVLNKFYGKKSVAFFQTSLSQVEAFSSELTVIGVEPDEMLQIKNENPFLILEAKLQDRKVSGAPSLPFFQGGALGYFSYDAVRFLEPSLKPLKEQQEKQVSFDAEFVFYRFYLVFDHFKKTAFLFHGAKSNLIDEIVRLEELRALESLVLSAEIEKLHLLNSELISKTASLPISEMNENFSKQEFFKQVEKLKHHILEGDIFQAVLSNHFTIPFHGDPLRLFEVLSLMSPAPYHFYFSTGERVYLGASPEMLIKAHGKQLETHPIAGTRPRGVNALEEKKQEQELLESEKEKAEHLMLVDLARNDLGRVSEPGSVAVSSFMKLRKFGGVMHLVSKVTSRLISSLSSLSALSSCFPAGTLSGAPKIRAMDLILEAEESKRGFYGGAFVAASLTGDLDSCISIRCISIEAGVAKVQAGAGIVSDSLPEMEYAEIEHKSALTRKALAFVIQEEKAYP